MDRGLALIWIIASMAAIVIWLGPGDAMASVPEGATESMEEGARLYQEQDYAGAAVAFRRAFEIHPDARFLYNAGRASHQGGNLRQAYRYYVGALEVDAMSLDAETAAMAQAHRRSLELRWTSEAMGEKWKQMTPEAVEVEFESSRWGTMGTSGAGIGAVGGLLLGISGVLARRTSSRMGALESGDVTTLDDYDLEVEAIERNQRWGQRSLYGGGALLVVGAGLVAWELGTVDEHSAGQTRIEWDGDGVRAVWEVRFE